MVHLRRNQFEKQVARRNVKKVKVENWFGKIRENTDRAKLTFSSRRLYTASFRVLQKDYIYFSGNERILGLSYAENFITK